MRLKNVLSLTTLAVLFAAAVPADATHGWSSYHWPRSCTTCPAVITVYDSTLTTNTGWPTHLNRSVFGDSANPNTTDRRGWNDSGVLTLSITAGGNSSTTRSACSPVTGALRVCNYTYGTSTGWLGLAQINTVSGSTSHIAWGTAKMNDSYFASGYPSTEKRHVMCQEVGHDFGLGHTSENGSSQNTCMDYYSNTGTSDWTSTGPNQHDFDQLKTQSHWSGAPVRPPTVPLVSRAPSDFDRDLGDLNDESQWGEAVEFDSEGRGVVYERILGIDKDGDEHAIMTHVYWADPLVPVDGPREGPRDGQLKVQLP
ncbi:MAG: hypothetical protein ABIT01_14690 [Thermoanaerobaculia bacterium]